MDGIGKGITRYRYIVLMLSVNQFIVSMCDTQNLQHVRVRNKELKRS